jgi:alpha-glucosidase
MVEKTNSGETRFKMKLTKLSGLASGMAVVLLCLCLAVPAFSASDVTVGSPNGNVQIKIFVTEKTGLSYELTFKKQPVIQASPLGIVVNNVNLGQGVAIKHTERYNIKESYPSRGVHSVANDHCNGAKISINHPNSKTTYTVDVRAYDDGVAFRYVVPGEKLTRTPDEATVFTIPDGSTVWYHGFTGHYEGIHNKEDISKVTAGDWAAVPLTFKLPNNLGYASITEGALMNYSGMGLEADGHRAFDARLGNAEPPSYPFTLRFGDAEAKRLSAPATITGTITTPWRIVMVGGDLNTLVNCDIVNNVSPPPDPGLFPDGINTYWVRPGRAVWKYLDGGDSTLDGMKEFSKEAGDLGFEYNVIEGFWQRWNDDQLRELVEYSDGHNVKLFVWKFSKELHDPRQRREFFRHLHDLGIAGAKIDFFDHEAKEVVDLYQAILKDAAEFQIMVVFHGANKPTGESRTWPNEVTREAVFGFEHKSNPTWAQHTTTLPFTRLLAGPADFTPMLFGDRRKETSWPHQIASAAILTSSLLTFAANPKSIVENPGVDLIKSIPSTWDQTIVLPVSEIGEIAAFARRKNDTWFLAVMNGETPKTIHVNLSFLAEGPHPAMLIRDQQDNPAAEKIENTVLSRSDSLTIDLRAGGGFIGRFLK